MTSLNAYDGIARYYDFLKRLVFGKTIFQSLIRHLGCVHPQGKILIVGGGTGEILSAILARYAHCRICYVEASSEMLRRAQMRVACGQRGNVKFLHGTEASINSGDVFDTVVTQFFLDQFTNDRGKAIVERLASNLRPGGNWLVSDFVDEGKWWQRGLLSVMYIFFRRLCRIEATELPSWQNHFSASGLVRVEGTRSFGGFIHSAVYRRP